jgi:hypothetical protein
MTPHTHHHNPLTAWITATPLRAIPHTFAVLEPLLQLPPHDREPLLDTLAAWLNHAGTHSQLAHRLGCPRTSVTARLNRIDQLTGRTRKSPQHIAELWVAVEALRVFGNDPDILLQLLRHRLSDALAPETSDPYQGPIT